MEHQHLEMIKEKVIDGYYETHEHHITEEHYARLSKDQLNFYIAQSNLYAERERSDSLKGWVIGLAIVAVISVLAAGSFAYIAFKPKDITPIRGTAADDSDSLSVPQNSNTAAGAKDSGSQ